MPSIKAIFTQLYFANKINMANYSQNDDGKLKSKMSCLLLDTNVPQTFKNEALNSTSGQILLLLEKSYKFT